MLYRPNFCCHCGEKIARSRWTILTSRRFCDFCEIEQKQHDLLPRAVVVIAVLIGSAGLTAYVGGGNATKTRVVRQQSNSSPDEPRRIVSQSNTNRISNVPAAAERTPDAVNGQRQQRASSSTEPVFFCNAVTRKGTQCTRRVKTRGRCWQHAEKPDAPDTALSEGKK